MNEVSVPATAYEREAGARNRWYVLFLMTAVYAVNIADRYVFSTLMEPIKTDLALSDSAVGFLTGVALAIFYVGAGIPLGILADRINRRNLIAISVAAWSTMTLLCGLSKTYGQLLLARIGVGIGEAGGTPPSQSLLADRFAPEERAVAMSIFAVGASLGATLGAVGGGWLADHFGWRAALICFGLAGLPVALIVRFSMKEPRRGQLDAPLPGGAKPSATDFRSTLRFVRSQRSLLHVLAGATVVTFWGWGLLWWTPSFLVRTHGLTVGGAGALLGPMHAVGGTAVLLLTAYAMHRIARDDPRRQCGFVALATLLATIPSLFAYATSSITWTTVMLWLFVPVTYIYIGPTFALVQSLVPATMRAQICAILLFVANVANLVLAPQLIGLASDWVAPRIEHPQESLRFVLLFSALTGFWGAYHFHAARKHLPEDLRNAGNSNKTMRSVP